MKKVVDYGNKRRSINVIDNIVYSHVKDLDGNPVDLMLYIMTQNGNSELKLAMSGSSGGGGKTASQTGNRVGPRRRIPGLRQESDAGRK